jgi:hypothetical protein
MSFNPHEDPAALKALQDAIYRDRVLRARSMSPTERLDEALEVTNSVFDRMLDGALHQLGTTDVEAGWAEVRRRLNRLSRVQDRDFYATSLPVTA